MEGPVALGPARGVVVERGSGRPIPGAWITWRAPPPGLVDSVFASPSLLAAGQGLISDAQGEFELARLADDEAPAWEVHAVAPGYAPGRARAGLGGQVRVELTPAGGLEVRLRTPLPVGSELALRGPDGARWTAPEAGDLRAWVLTRLGAGRWEVWIDGALTGEARVEAGRQAWVEVTPPPQEALAGAVVGLEPEELEGARLELRRSGARRSVALDREGRFADRAPRGRWAAWVIGPLVELPLGPGGDPGEPLTVGEAGPALRLTPPARDAVQVELDDPQAAEGDELALIALADGPARGAVGVVRLRRGARGLTGQARAVRGPQAVLVGGAFVGEVTLPQAGPLALGSRPVTLAVRWRWPEGLGAEERMRGRAALLPRALPETVATRLEAELAVPFQAGPATPTLELGASCPGDYVLRGQSDLGPFQREVRLPLAEELVVDLDQP